MHTSDFDFELPPELIAQRPAGVRHESRLLHLKSGQLTDHRFLELVDLLRPGDLLVGNDTRVIKARLLGHKQSTGGRVEALIERITGSTEALAQLRASKVIRDGTRLLFSQCVVRVLAREGDFYRLQFDQPVQALLDRVGQIPLPPYIAAGVNADDELRYQTVYAAHPGSVAAPTAGLHFDATVFAALAARGIEHTFVTLHVGAGTFKPIRDEDLSKHRMHVERYEISRTSADIINAARTAGRRIVAIGTTSLRTLESACDPNGEIGATQGQTDLFITPGYRFKLVDALVTNFHLPRSTLLMLVCAFAGRDPVRRAYAHAIANRYRFFSYGDAMLIEREHKDA
jgi:S-adenosylmethionine:tRNA ribosyltransferase-isomerase